MVKLEMKRADEIIPAHAASAKPMLSEGSSPAPSRVPVLVGKRPERSGGEGWRRFCWQGPGGTWTDPEPVASLERKARGAKSLAEHPASCVLQFTPGPPRACLVDATSCSQKTATFSGGKRYGRKKGNRSSQNALRRAGMFTRNAAGCEHLGLTQVGVPNDLGWSADPQGL